MNYNLLPPRPTLGEALKILNLSNTKEGKRQLYLHIVDDGLPAYTTLHGEFVTVSDENIEHINLTKFLTVPVLINDGLNPNSFSHVGTEERILQADMRGSDKNEKGFRLIAESYRIGGNECYKIVPSTKVDVEAMREGNPDESPMVKYGISQCESMLNKVEQKSVFWEIEKRTLDENHIHFKRDELISFAEQYSGLGFVKAEKRKSSSSLDKSLSQDSVYKDESPSKAALKVIGLFMMDLAKTQKYASGDNPNLSAIKGLLLKLAGEFNIKTHGLNKADELILKNALLYLKEQENDGKKEESDKKKN